MGTKGPTALRTIRHDRHDRHDRHGNERQDLDYKDDFFEASQSDIVYKNCIQFLYTRPFIFNPVSKRKQLNGNDKHDLCAWIFCHDLCLFLF